MKGNKHSYAQTRFRQSSTRQLIEKEEKTRLNKEITKKTNREAALRRARRK